MLISSWKEPVYNSGVIPEANADYSRPPKLSYRQQEVHVDEWGYQIAPGFWETQYAAIRYIIDGETVHERKFPTLKAALRQARKET